MACPLTQGFTISCDDIGMGGIEEIYITEFENITSSTVVSGEVTVLAQAASTDFHKYEVRKQDADFVTTENFSEENGSLFYETVLNFTTKKLSNTKNVELKLLAQNRVVIIVKDNNAVYHIFGIDNGAVKGGTNQAASGKAFGDGNQYTLGFSAMENHFAYTVQAAVVTGLSIS